MNTLPFPKQRLVASILMGMCASSMAQTPAVTQALSLKRIALSSSGVGYFEYEAKVQGNAVLALPVALDQVDDVLKSLVVYDAQGRVGGISLPGLDPIAQTLKQLPFEAAALNKPAALLEALRGAQISVGGATPLVGRIVSVQVQAATVQSPLKHTVMLMTDTGLQQFILEDAKHLQFEDPTLRTQIEQALKALSNNRSKDGRTIEISSLGEAHRTVRVGFVSTVPIWKNTYRMTLPNPLQATSTDANQALAQVQGWAVIENMSGQDWTGVELTLTSGKSVAFSQPLYRSYYNQRPQIAIDLPGQTVPQADRGTIALSGVPRPVIAPAPGSGVSVARMASAPAASAPLMADALMQKSEASTSNVNNTAMAAAFDATQVQEQSTQVSYTFGLPVTVGSGRSLSIPIIQASLPMSRVALYRPNVNAQFPLAAVEVLNNTDQGLPVGAVTLYEASSGGNTFVGDAQLAVLPARDKRYLAYALDQKISIQHRLERREGAEIESSLPKPAAGVMPSPSPHPNPSANLRYRIQGANLIVSVVETQTSVFIAKSSDALARTVVFEVPQYGESWKLLPPKGDAYTLLGVTQNQYRVSTVLAGGETRTIRVVQESSSEQSTYLGNVSTRELLELSNSPKTSAPGQTVLRTVLGLRQTLERHQQNGQNLAERLEETRQEQGRIRENLKAVPVGSEPHKRYIAELTRIDGQDASIQGDIKINRNAQQIAEKAMNDYLQALR